MSRQVILRLHLITRSREERREGSGKVHVCWQLGGWRPPSWSCPLCPVSRDHLPSAPCAPPALSLPHRIELGKCNTLSTEQVNTTYIYGNSCPLKNIRERERNFACYVLLPSSFLCYVGSFASHPGQPHLPVVSTSNLSLPDQAH